jgi:hypothetical protein
MTEIWKPITDHIGYEISDLGNVRSFYNNKWGLSLPHNIKLLKNNHGYLFFQTGRSRKNIPVSGTVAKIFLPNPQNKPQINHIDGNPLNNNVENLEWCTAKENTYHAWRTGLCKNHLTKSTDKKVRVIKHAISFGVCGTQKVLAKMLQVSEVLISQISGGKKWKHVII